MCLTKQVIMRERRTGSAASLFVALLQPMFQLVFDKFQTSLTALHVVNRFRFNGNSSNWNSIRSSSFVNGLASNDSRQSQKSNLLVFRREKKEQ